MGLVRGALVYRMIGVHDLMDKPNILVLMEKVANEILRFFEGTSSPITNGRDASKCPDRNQDDEKDEVLLQILQSEALRESGPVVYAEGVSDPFQQRFLSRHITKYSVVALSRILC